MIIKDQVVFGPFLILSCCNYGQQRYFKTKMSQPIRNARPRSGSQSGRPQLGSPMVVCVFTDLKQKNISFYRIFRVSAAGRAAAAAPVAPAGGGSAWPGSPVRAGSGPVSSAEPTTNQNRWHVYIYKYITKSPISFNYIHKQYESRYLRLRSIIDI